MTEPRVRIDVWSDYNCPWCFLASSSLEKLEGSHPVDVQWHSYELRPKGSPPMSAEYRARIEENKPRLYAMAREQYGLELNQGPFGIDSRPALVGAKFAEAQGVGKAYHHALMYAYWIHAMDIGDRSVLGDLAVSVGLEREAYLAALDDPQYDEQVQLDVDQARQYGLNGVPALVFDNRYLISGAQPYPVLVQATEQVLAELVEEGA
ncbi:MAG: DsbA family oxidoreductase [Caldilineaceae bacterium]|nr:DsbA family oxidoreductase [Caldilineaceae bacterium]